MAIASLLKAFVESLPKNLTPASLLLPRNTRALKIHFDLTQVRVRGTALDFPC